MSDQTPAGWYDNPERPGTLRYWDGSAWTDHIHEQQPAQPAPPPASQTSIGAPPPAQPAYGYGDPHGSGVPLETPGFIGAFTDAVTKNYAKFDGRTSIGGFWRFTAINIAISVVLSVLGEVSTLFGVINLLVGLALFIPGLSVSVRRLHDIGRSGWWLLIAFTLIGIIVLIVWFATAGNPGQNDHGAPPRQATA